MVSFVHKINSIICFKVYMIHMQNEIVFIFLFLLLNCFMSNTNKKLAMLSMKFNIYEYIKSNKFFGDLDECIIKIVNLCFIRTLLMIRCQIDI